MYRAIAEFYDNMMPEKYYDSFASFCRRMIKKYSKAKGNDSNIVLDAGCGTGNLTLRMAKYGYDMIGLDISEEMLNVARQNENGEFRENRILWTCQDMCKMDLFGTAACIISSTDTVCHLTKEKQLRNFLKSVKNYLTPGGIFIFDVLTEEYFEREIDGNVFYSDNEDGTFIWQGFYNKKTRICTYTVTSFSLNGDGTYSREDEEIREKAFYREEISGLLGEYGLEIAEVREDPFTPKKKDFPGRVVFTVKHKPGTT